LTAKFAMILRCPYSCAEAGVVLINLWPVITNSTSKERMATSLFSGWISDLCTIHGEFGYKVRIVSMGATAAKSLSDAISSYKKMSDSVIVTKWVDPAAVSRMNVVTSTKICPIPSWCTATERYQDTFFSVDTTGPVKASYSWTRYPHKSLSSERMTIEAIGALGEAPVDRTRVSSRSISTSTSSTCPTTPST